MSEILKVMVSSTSRDLPEYRQQVQDACLRASMFPIMMEQLPALDADAIEASLALVEEADIYVGLFAHRYGYIPDEHDISITEMEYERAVERGIPRLLFLMHSEVAVKPADFDTGDSADKLTALKARLKKERVVGFFESPKDLRGQALHALTEARKQLEDAIIGGEEPATKVADLFHYVSTIPEKGKPYIAHPYTLLQTRGLVGRKRELDILTDWVTKSKLRDVTIFNIVAIGGMGKSALTWTWFNDIAPQEKKWAGQVWWSFYESDATFENFVTRTLAYVSGRSLESLKNTPIAEQQDALLNALSQESFLLVLDGLERILIAYARQDAAYLLDENTLDEETSNYVAKASGLPQSAGKSFVGKHQLRKTADVRAGQFLRKLARLSNTRILASTRLYPADLQVPTGQLLPGCSALFLKGLSDADALELWRAYGAKGSRETMLPVFHTFEKHPLLLQLLAYEVAEFREAPGDFDAWRAAHPEFDPFDLPLVQVQTEVLTHALRGLSKAELRTLHVIAGFRMPASIDTLKALLISIENGDDHGQRPFATFKEMDQSLTILEDRGLLGWDRRANRYDLHPIVRGVVWSRLDDTQRSDIYGSLRSHFEAMPMMEDYLKVETVEDLTPAIELYNTLIELGQYDAAFMIFYEKLDAATLWRLSASRLRVELLERLFPNGTDSLPSLSNSMTQAFAIDSLAGGYHFAGRPGTAVMIFERALRIDSLEGDQSNLSVSMCNLSQTLTSIGALYRSEATAKIALVIAQDIKYDYPLGMSLYLLGLVLPLLGKYEEAERFLQHSYRIWIDQNHEQFMGVTNAYLSKASLLQNTPDSAKKFAEEAWRLAGILRLERDIIRAARLQGSAAMQLGDLDYAKEKLHFALRRAHNVQVIEEELATLIALADLNWQQKEPENARNLLEEVWESAERGPYPIFHADALLVLAKIEQDAGNNQAAIEAATEAYRKAWCDGPPYAYYRGLTKAKELLKTLEAPEPEMPAFDPSKFEPMPEVEINPDDEFGS
ncbi:MAG: DUF4062 domain-containing protein [Calditrichia bacterium]